jgi:signal transduction histidine kinase
VGSPSPGEAASASSEVLRKLQAVTDAALAPLSLDGLLDELLTRIREALDADTCAVLLLDETGRELVARAAKGIEEEVERGVRIPVGKGFAGRIAATGTPVVIEDVDHADVLNPLLREKGIKSLMGAPLVTGTRILGVVHVGTLRPRIFSSDDVDLLQIVASRAALGIEAAIVHDELVRLSEAQRDFVALAAHELRSPATTVYGLVATLRKRRSQLDPDTVEELDETLYAQAERMRRLVEQLLDLSRLDAKTIEISRAPVALRSHIVKIVRAVAEAPDEIAVEVAPDLEATIDAEAVEHVVANLVTNAMQYGAPPVTVSAECRDRHVRIVVEDRGDGVGPEFVPRLFERFQRNETARHPSGTGLGLAIARSYAQAHGGDLFYMPADSGGARFELVLPVNA